jgi:hypothetical protein
MRKMFVFLIITICLAGLAQAITIPHAFYGTAINENGNKISDGLTITAKLNGEEVDSATVTNGRYGYGDDTLIVTDENENGGTITFFIDGTEANQESTFTSGEITELDLTFNGVTAETTSNNDEEEESNTEPDDTTTTTPATSGGSGGGGGSGGSSGGSSGGGGGSAPLNTVKTTIPPTINPPTVKTTTSSSSNDEEKVVENVASNLKVKPQSDTQRTAPLDDNFFNAITGGVIGLTGTSGKIFTSIIVVVIVLALGTGLGYLKAKKK